MLIGAVCSDAVLAKFISIMKNGLSIIQILVPILLILEGTIQLIKMMINPDDKNNSKAIGNTFAAAIIILFLPGIMNLVMSIISSTGEYGKVYDSSSKKNVVFDISSCWTDAASVSGDSSMDSANDKSSKSVSKS